MEPVRQEEEEGGSRGHDPGHASPASTQRSRDTSPTASPLESLSGPDLAQTLHKQAGLPLTAETTKAGPFTRAVNWLKASYATQKDVLGYAFAATGISITLTTLASAKLVSSFGASNFWSSVGAAFVAYSWYGAFFALTYFGRDKQDLQMISDSSEAAQAKRKLFGGYLAAGILMEGVWLGSFVGIQNAMHSQGVSTGIATFLTHLGLASFMNLFIPPIRYALAPKSPQAPKP
ncbi:MAG: hypothetical protein DCC75_06850 [Proteobacteria bacterium]|nr:MAG: hypothetical protein DCC75_06850 [Pseudomonadota bacterium]